MVSTVVINTMLNESIITGEDSCVGPSLAISHSTNISVLLKHIAMATIAEVVVMTIMAAVKGFRMINNFAISLKPQFSVLFKLYL